MVVVAGIVPAPGKLKFKGFWAVVVVVAAAPGTLNVKPPVGAVALGAAVVVADGRPKDIPDVAKIIDYWLHDVYFS